MTTHHVAASDGVEISFDLYQKPGREHVVVVCPGFFQSKETPTFQRLAKTLVEWHDCILMDFRGHGDSGGLFAFSACESADLMAVLAWARQRYQRLGVIGFSLGAATAVNVMSRLPIARTLILVSAPSSFEEIEFQFWTPEAIRTGIGGLEPGTGCRPGNPWMKKEKPIENIERIAPLPVLLIHGTKDAIISHRHSERLYQAAQDPKRLLLIQEGGHAEELSRRNSE